MQMENTNNQTHTKTVNIDGYDGEFTFELYENTQPIEIGDAFLFHCLGVYDVQICTSEQEKFEINPNNRPRQEDKIDLIYNFWSQCFKIKSTDFDLTKIQ